MNHAKKTAFPGIDAFEAAVRSGRVPESMPEELGPSLPWPAFGEPWPEETRFPPGSPCRDLLLRASKARRSCARRGVWSCASMGEWSLVAKALSSLGVTSVVEAFAGAALPSQALSSLGLECHPHDPDPVGWTFEHSRMRRLTKVGNLSAQDAAKTMPEAAFLMSWAPNSDTLALESLGLRPPGSIAVMVGSPKMCATPEAWDLPVPILDMMLPGWPFCQERLLVGRLPGPRRFPFPFSV